MVDFKFGHYLNFSDEEVSAPVKWDYFANIPDKKLMLEKILHALRNPSALLNHSDLFTPGVLVTGTSGTPKIKFVLAFAEAFTLPTMVVRPHLLFSGDFETISQNISDLFVEIKKETSETIGLVVFDSLDVIARSRDDPTEVGNLKRIAGIFSAELELLFQEDYQVLVVGISSYPRLIDKEVLSMFPVNLNFDVMDVQSAHDHWKILEGQMKQSFPKISWDIEELASASIGFSHKQLDEALSLAIIEYGLQEKETFDTSLLLQQLRHLQKGEEQQDLLDSDIDLRELRQLLSPYFRQKR